MDQRVRVFLSSKERGMELVREHAVDVCAAMELEVLRHPPAPAGTGSADLDDVARADILVLILRGEIRPRVNREVLMAERLGIPIIPLEYRGPTPNRYVAEHRGRFHPSFIGSFRTLADLQTQLRMATSWIMRERVASRLDFQAWTSEVYRKSSGLIDTAQVRIAIVQETSTLLLGPHRDRDRRIAEEEFHKAIMMQLLESSRSNGGLEFLHVFNRRSTAKAMKNTRDYPDAPKVAQRVAELLEFSQSPWIKFAGTDAELTPTIISDSSFGMSVRFSSRRYYAFANHFHAGANSLWDILQGVAKDVQPLQEIWETGLLGWPA